MPRTTKRSARRAGFTMVEMLVVVTIIAILLSLTTAGVLALIGTQQTFNTKTELTRIEGDLQRAYRSAGDKFRKEPIPTTGAMNSAYAAVTTIAGGDRDRARVIWSKLRLKQTFPNNFSEALNPAPTLTTQYGVQNIALSYYTTKLAALNYTAANTYPTNSSYQVQPWESCVCLLLALQRGEDSAALKESDIGTGSLKDFGAIPYLAKDPSSGPSPNGQTIKGLVDNWGTPLAFCRWSLTTPPVPPNTIPTSTLSNGDNNDSDDPSGLLESATWQQQNAGSFFGQFQSLCHPLPSHTSGEATSYRIFPLVVSAGPDKRLGLDKEPVGVGPTYSLTTQPFSYSFTVLPSPNDSLSKDNLYPALASPK